MKTRSFIYLLLLISVECSGQNGGTQYKFWNQESLKGEIGLKGHYRNLFQELGNGFEVKGRGTLLSGGLLLESVSSIIRPGILGIDFELEYNPEKLSAAYTSIPDRTDVRTLKRLNLRTIFFQEKKLSFHAFVNLSENFINRENFSNSRTKRKYFGGGFIFKNKVLPFSVDYEEGNWDQVEIETGRTFSYWQRSVKAKASRSFYAKDKHRLSYSFDDYIRVESYSLVPRRNKIHYIILNSTFFLDRKKNYHLTTVISDFNQKGTNDLNRLQASANLNMTLHQSLKLTGSYNYLDTRDPLFRLYQNNARLNLEHRLFESLRTNVFTEVIFNRHSIYQEDDYRLGFDINYTKKIPLHGLLNVSYRYTYRNFNRTSEPIPLRIINEEHVLADDQIVLLDKPFAEKETVIVKDVTGTIIYQLNFDYLLIEQNNYIEIKRIPGGQIPDKATVLVDYTTTLPGNYSFLSNSQSLYISVMLFRQFIELYYRRNKQNYSNVEKTLPVALNYFTENIYGLRFNIAIARFGVEYNDYKSNIIPFQLLRFFINLNWRINDRLLFSLTGNTRYYLTIGERVNELYADVSGRLAYSFTSRIKLNLEVLYRDQKGYQIDLDYLSARSELTMIVRKVYITLGIEAYRRIYLNRETIKFGGAYVSIVRKFKMR
ncbi:MAG: hypothetical protein L3J31_07175 [Bacteroidales bacterium]|nr:hypothetical protein [Bacteroidales bacterium]MCF6342568.1 hypothetical protein [Bacteroidales bacterium]